MELRIAAAAVPDAARISLSLLQRSVEWVVGLGHPGTEQENLEAEATEPEDVECELERVAGGECVVPGAGGNGNPAAAIR